MACSGKKVNVISRQRAARVDVVQTHLSTLVLCSSFYQLHARHTCLGYLKTSYVYLSLSQSFICQLDLCLCLCLYFCFYSNLVYFYAIKMYRYYEEELNPSRASN